MEKLNKKFEKGNVLKAEELNLLVDKINELAKKTISIDDATDIPVGSIPTKGIGAWTAVAPTPFAGSIDVDNMLVPAFDLMSDKWVFIPISIIQSGNPSVSSGFPYHFPFKLS